MRGGGGGGATPTPLNPLRTAGKRTLEWGAKIAQISVSKPTVSAKTNPSDRVEKATIFLKMLKNNRSLHPETPLYQHAGVHGAPQNALFLPWVFRVAAAMRTRIFTQFARFSH